jgi:hypothetical protein
MSSSKHWTASQLAEEVKNYEAALRDADFKEDTIESYISRASIFVRWLEGDYDPKVHGPHLRGRD